MKATCFGGLCLLLLAGCNDSALSSKPSPSNSPAAVDPTNTGTNTRDRGAATKTPIDQNENQADIDLTAGIRKRVIGSSGMSTEAQNIKIITQDGKVTLRGPVKSTFEKDRIEIIAHEVAGVTNVDSQLDVAP
ncbi:MAG TPA: BON domain-containing protein [Pirellulales bacterium]